MKQNFLYSSEFDFPVYDGVLRKIVTVFFMPRSGSTLLACLLAQTKKLGFPLEYFSPKNFEMITRRLNGLSAENIAPLLRVRTSANGIFGYKWNYDFEKKDEIRIIREKLCPQYLILTDRKDREQQARSLCIARKTGDWVLPKREHSSSGIKDMAVEAWEIKQTQQELQRDRENLHRMIERLRIPVIEVFYEDILGNEQNVVSHIGRFCGEQINGRVSIELVPISKQSPEDSEKHTPPTAITSQKEGDSNNKPIHRKIESTVTSSFQEGISTNNRPLPLKLLLATNHLFTYTGSEITLLTLAKELSLRGHNIFVYSKYISHQFVRKFSEFSSVTDDLKKFDDITFDAAYVQHNPIALEVRHSRPALPIFFASLGILPFLEQPPPINVSVDNYLAISEEVKDNLIKGGISREIIYLFRNIVDSGKFRPLRTLNHRPQSAAIYSYKIDRKTMELIVAACAHCGIIWRHIGVKPGEIDQEALPAELNKYDIVFTLGRGVIETMMCAKIPLVLDIHGGDGMVTPENMSDLMQNNFSGRFHRKRYSVDELVNEIQRYRAENGPIMRELAIRHFDAKLCVNSFVEIVNEKLHSKIKKMGRLDTGILQYCVNLIKTTKDFTEAAHNIQQREEKEKSTQPVAVPSESKMRKGGADQTEQSGRVRLIAFYLPQFHRIAENDKWWGKGFTEWSNVTSAKPLFPGHYQPQLPADLGFYDLRVPETMDEQAQLAKQYGIYGFCYYHYWFNGSRLLEKPVSAMLRRGEPDFPFCLCWANENWTRSWDGGANQILMEQRYSHSDDLAHIRYLLPIFDDHRYIRVDGKPVFLVYRAKKLPEARRTTDIWRVEAKRAGIGDLYLCLVESFSDEHCDPAMSGFDAAIEFQPDWSRLKPELRDPRYPDLQVYSYPKIVTEMLKKPMPGYKRFPCVVPRWDNSPRRGRKGTIFIDSSPEQYELWLKNTIAKFRPPSPSENFVFINAWNEWAEGNHLEPDQQFRHTYLISTQRALSISAEEGKDGNRPELSLRKKNDFDSIRASIIIPVFNQLEYTKRCIQSIFQNTDNKLYELIIVDNNSTDGHQQYLDKLKGQVVVIKNKENLGFAKACNQGAAAACGEFLVFLNNDTEPQTRWLDALVAAADKNSNAGAVGAKLVYPDGRLQEAGALIFSDGSGDNFGRGKSPDNPVFNIACEVDYCSGACLLVRRDIFKRIGGFDERYSPAYYEETDLCFAIRKLGCQVLYEPGAVVIHHESVTADSLKKDFSKSLIEINRRKFAAKWENELTLQDLPPKISGRLPVTASRMRLKTLQKNVRPTAAGPAAKAVVFFPHNPWPPMTGAHRRCLSLLSSLRGMGMEVVLVSSLAFSDQPWSEEAERRLKSELGVSCAVHVPDTRERLLIRGHCAASGSERFHRYKLPGLARFFGEICRQHKPDIVLINYAYWGYLADNLPDGKPLKVIEMHDLVGLNEKMQKKIWQKIGNPPFGPGRYNTMKEWQIEVDTDRPETPEIEVYDKFDLVMAISDREAQCIRPHLHRAVVETLPMAYLPAEIENTYAGAPVLVISANVFNFQGYLFLIDEILPNVRTLFPKFEVHVIGDACRYLAPAEGVKLLGYQESLAPHYAKAPFALCPLLAGTGQQVKIVEAMGHGVPVIAMRQVTASAPIIHGQNGFIAEDAADFARWVRLCLEQRELCERLGKNARRTIGENFSPQILQDRLKGLLQRIGDGRHVAPAKNIGSRPIASSYIGEPRHILWVRADAIGDNVLAASMLPALKKQYPGARITVLCQSHITDLYETCPQADEVIGFDLRRALADGAYRWDIAGRLGALGVDWALNSVYSREPLGDLFAAASRAMQIVGFQGDLCNVTAEQRHRANKAYTLLIGSSRTHAPELERHREFLVSLGVTSPKLQPILWLNDEDDAFAKDFFATNEFDEEHTIALFAGAQADIRRYPRYGEALAEVCQRHHLQVVALGAASDAALNRACLTRIGVPVMDLSGQTSLRQAAAVIKHCRLAVGSESGLAHMACAVGTPQVVLVGGGHFGRFMPYSNLTTLACLPLECYGCNWRCPLPAARCVQALHPMVLSRAVEAALTSRPKRPRIFMQTTKAQTVSASPQWCLPHQPDLVDDVEVVHVEVEMGIKPEAELSISPKALSACSTTALPNNTAEGSHGLGICLPQA